MKLFLCGDVMTGRGIDQALRHPVNPVLYESYIRDAREYVKLAEAAHGRIPRPLDFDYIWGEALHDLDRAGVDLRIINLETAITSGGTPWPGKEIHYRMHPRNIDCLSAVGIDACALANNHTLDWGLAGLSETLRTLDSVRIAHAGAGESAQEAANPAVLDVAGKARVLLFSFGSVTSGIPREWSATDIRGGVNLVRDVSEATALRIADRMRQLRKPGDVLIASIHWGGNWGYDIPEPQIKFARRLIEEGVAVVHGHSSHHVKAIDVFKGRLILYGCGDFLTDYEGISGHGQFRGDLALMYLIEISPENGHLISAEFVPLQMRQFRLQRTSSADAEWLRDLLNRLGTTFGTRFGLRPRGNTIEWRPKG